MALLERVQADMVAAMKAKDEARLNAIRMIKAALQKQQIDSMKPLDDAAEQQILKQLVKQRTDAAEMFRKGGRPEQAENSSCSPSGGRLHRPLGQAAKAACPVARTPSQARRCWSRNRRIYPQDNQENCEPED